MAENVSLHIRMQRLADQMDLVAFLMREGGCDFPATKLEAHARYLRNEAQWMEARAK